MSYIDRIRNERQKQGITQKQMADLLGTTQQQYSKYENKIQEMPVRHLQTICRELNLSSDYILDLNINIQDVT